MSRDRKAISSPPCIDWFWFSCWCHSICDVPRLGGLPSCCCCGGSSARLSCQAVKQTPPEAARGVQKERVCRSLSLSLPPPHPPSDRPLDSRAGVDKGFPTHLTHQSGTPDSLRWRTGGARWVGRKGGGVQRNREQVKHKGGGRASGGRLWFHPVNINIKSYVMQSVCFYFFITMKTRLIKLLRVSARSK